MEKEQKPIIIWGDSVKNWLPTDLNKMDLIISQPPLGYKLMDPIIGKFGQIRNAEQFLIEKGLQSLKAKGKLVLCLSNGFLFREGIEKSLRKYLVEEDLLETIVSFQKGLLLNTTIPFRFW
jgi:type I restriction enzyme M protein